MSEYAVRALDASTLDAFTRLAEKHNGMGFGGCWCTRFHPRPDKLKTEDGRAYKERLVREGKAHAALVFDGDAAVAWCQYGSPEELPRIYHRKEWEAGLTGEAPAYRITCIFVDRDYRRKGVAAVAVRGALDLIAKAGGGVVEGYPQDLPQGADRLGERCVGDERVLPDPVDQILTRHEVASVLEQDLEEAQHPRRSRYLVRPAAQQMVVGVEGERPEGEGRPAGSLRRRGQAGGGHGRKRRW